MNAEQKSIQRNAKTFSLLALLLSIIVLLNATNASAYNSLIVVDTLSDNGTPMTCTLRDAVQAANSDTSVNGCSAGSGGDTIAFGALAGEIVLGSEIVVAGDLLIQGDGDIIIDGNRATRLFKVTSGRVRFDSLTLQNGKDVGYECGRSCGGAIKLEGGKVEILNSLVDLNKASYGGAIFVGGNELTIQDSILRRNSGIYGGAISSGGTTMIHRSVIDGNVATNVGGGIAHGGNTLIVENSTISNNHGYYAGGIDISSSAAIVAITNSFIQDNTADVDGGGMYNSGNTIVTNSTFVGNHAEWHGGGIHNTDKITLNNSTLSGNTSNFGGGGIRNSWSGHLALANSTLYGNSAPTGGGIQSFGDSVALNNSIVAGSPEGGNCYLEDGLIYIGLDNLSDDELCLGASLSTNINLAELADNGCTTQHATVTGFDCIQTHALLPDSDAIDNPNSNSASATDSDQREFAIHGDYRDIGAFEVQGVPSAVTVLNQSVVIYEAEWLLVALSWSLLTVLTIGIFWRRVP